MGQLCYTTQVNYVLFGGNCNDNGEWLGITAMNIWQLTSDKRWHLGSKIKGS